MPGTPSSATCFGALTSAEVSALDAAAAELGLATAMLMELAGWQVARLLDRLIGGLGEVLVVAGSGNNGGDALVAARHLHTWGHTVGVQVVAAAGWRLAALATVLSNLGIPLEVDPTGAAAGAAISAAIEGPGSWLVDGLLGTGLNSPPLDQQRGVIEVINASHLMVLAVDVPSGLNATTGTAYPPTVNADVTCTLTALKSGLDKPTARRHCGDIWIADIGMPRAAWQQTGLAQPTEIRGGELLSLPTDT